jgi:hypothetical protein
MNTEDFTGYIGSQDIHDGTILRVIENNKVVIVRIQGASGKHHLIKFNNVTEVQANEPVGMILYAISEMKLDSAKRKFIFVNWEEDDSASLEILAEDYQLEEDVVPKT